MWYFDSLKGDIFALPPATIHGGKPSSASYVTNSKILELHECYIKQLIVES